MPITTPHHRLKFVFVLGAVLGLTALAVPTAASAAQTCVTGTVPTAATQPWQIYSVTPNAFQDSEDAYETLLAEFGVLLATVNAGFTQVEFDALQASLLASQTTAQASLLAAGTVSNDQLTALEAGLNAADPANQAANLAILAGFEDAITASQYGAPLNTTFSTFFTGFGTYMNDIQAAITANTPRPTLPPALSDALDDTLASVDGFGAFAGDVFHGGAAAQVVFAQVCTETVAPAALAATGSNDPTPLIGGATLLLLVGAGVLVAARRRAVAHN